MSILIYTESENGKFKKSAYELASYGRAIADQLGIELIAVSFNHNSPEVLGTYGVDRVIQINDVALKEFTALKYATNLSEIVNKNLKKKEIENKLRKIFETKLMKLYN